MKRQLHTPEGVRDIFGQECEKKHIIDRAMKEAIVSYGYEQIETPSFEFFDIFSREIGTIPSKDLYKFFDREGNTLALRPDVTPSIARAYANYFKDVSPLRLFYSGNTACYLIGAIVLIQSIAWRNCFARGLDGGDTLCGIISNRLGGPFSSRTS